MSAIEYDEPRAIAWFSLIADLWRRCEHPFDKMISPEVRYHPPGIVTGSRFHACHLFFTGFANRYGKKAEEVCSKASRIAVERPHLIDPAMEKTYSFDDIEALVSVIAFAQNEPERVDWWLSGCLGILRDEYDCDPRQIFTSLELSGDSEADRERLIIRLKRFKGIGQKIGQLIISWFQGVDWQDEPEKWQKLREIQAVATDLWVMRLMRMCDIIVSWESDHSTAISKNISDFISRICLENQISHNDLNQALWHIGSVICGTMRPNSGPYRHVCYGSCPAINYCKGIVPSNYRPIKRVDGKRKGVNSQRLASMCYAERVPHIPNLEDLLTGRFVT